MSVPRIHAGGLIRLMVLRGFRIRVGRFVGQLFLHHKAHLLPIFKTDFPGKITECIFIVCPGSQNSCFDRAIILDESIRKRVKRDEWHKKSAIRKKGKFEFWHTTYSVDKIDWTLYIGGVELHCPFCGNDETKVLESRQVEEGTAVRRRRECERCARRFTTFEKFEDTPLIVVKRMGAGRSFPGGNWKPEF